MNASTSCFLWLFKSSELSQAYKFLANFYLKKMKLDNASDAATKCLEFPEVTRSKNYFKDDWTSLN